MVLWNSAFEEEEKKKITPYALHAYSGNITHLHMEPGKSQCSFWLIEKQFPKVTSLLIQQILHFSRLHTQNHYFLEADFHPKSFPSGFNIYQETRFFC